MPLNILTFNWHEPYIYLLAKTGHFFEVVLRLKGGRKEWLVEQRPVPENIILISEDHALRKCYCHFYDIIICQNIDDLLLVKDIEIPKILIFHNKLSTEITLGGNTISKEDYLKQVKLLIEQSEPIKLLFISQTKKMDWGLEGYVITPGIDPNEFENYQGHWPKVLRVGNFLKERDIMMGFSLQEEILKGIPSTILGLNPTLPNARFSKSFEDLKKNYSRHRLYLNTTVEDYEDGYNLATLEAMATGMPIVSIANRTSPIIDGVNGYISDNIEYLRERIRMLLMDKGLAKRIGKEARNTVVEKFGIKEFLEKWNEVIENSVNNGKRLRAENDKGLKVLLSYTSNPQTTAAYIEKAMRKICDVITYGPSISKETLIRWNLLAIEDKIKEHQIPFIDGDLKKVFKQLPLGWKPDVFLYIDTGISYPLINLDAIKCIKSCYLIDTHLNLEKHIEIAKNFDVVFIAQKADVKRFKERGIKNVFWIPLACDPEIHGKKTNNKLYDIGFVGSLTDPKRVELLDKLKRRFNLYYERCFLERMAEVFSQSKIVFNKSIKNDLNMRVFEAMASGSMLLTDEAKGSGLTEMFQDRKHLVIYRDEKELFELADYYLRNDDEREKIAAEGMRQVLTKHTYNHRVKEMVEILGLFVNERKCKSYGRIFDTHPEAVVLQPYCVGKGIDVGCGFRKTHPDAIGVDLLGKGEIGEHGCMKGMQSVADIKASGDNLYMFKDGELDYVVSRHNLEHYVDVVKTLREWKRVLKVGGVLGMVLPDESKINTIALDPTHKHCFTPSSIKNLLELIGDFEIERLEPVIENWSFVVIARKVKKMVQETEMPSDYFSQKSSDTHEKLAKSPTSFADVKEGDYYRQERKDVEALIPKEARRILDVGCGEGILGKRLLEKGVKEVVGVEIEQAVCEKARENLSMVVCGDIEKIDLPFEERYFDCIVFADILEHLKDPLSVVKKLKKHLKDSGVVVASIPNVRYYQVINMLVDGYWTYGDYGILDRTHLRFFTKKEILALFKNAGFEITTIAGNVDPKYYTVCNSTPAEISFGRISLKDLSSEEIKDLFVFQYLIKAKKDI